MNKKIYIFTNFYDNQVGYNVFLYRVNLMRRIGEIVVVSNAEIAKDKLHLADNEFIFFKDRFKGTIGLFVYLFRIWTFCLRKKPSLVFLMQTRLAVYRYFFRSKTNCILFWDIHPTQIFGISSKKRNRLFGRFVDGLNDFLREACYKGARLSCVVMPAGEALAEDLIGKKVESYKVKLVYLGVGDMFLPSFKDKPVEMGLPLKLLYAGSLNQERGRDVMLQGLALAISRGVKASLTLIGCDLSEKSNVENIAIKLGIRSSIVMLDRMDGEKIPAYMHHADIGVNLWEMNPYFYMNPPTKLFEYMVAGLPVIVNDIQTHNVYVKDKVTGFIISYDARSLANTIEYIYKNKYIIPRMSLSARTESEKYRWIYQEEKIMEIFKIYV